MPEHTGASNAEAAPALEQGEKFPAIMSSSSLVPSAGSLLMWLLLSAECKEGFCVGIVAVGFSSALCEAGSAAGVWVKPLELRGVAGEFLQQQLVVALPEGWSLHGAAVMDLGSLPSPVLPTIDHGILESFRLENTPR